MEDKVDIPVGFHQVIHGDVGGVPDEGTIVFVHGSGSSRHSPRNQHVAQILQDAGFETVLLDLLTADEEERDRQTMEYRFDIDLLTGRVLQTMAWLLDRGDDRPIGLFGASTGAAAALRAAAREPDWIGAVVSRGGRPDLAHQDLSDVVAPTLLIVGSDDPDVLQLNQRAVAGLNEDSSLEVVEDAGHLFEEPGKMDRVAELAADWFREHLGPLR
jgi:pimeloyl-ACP methyl ester carboxylesterase